MQGGSYYSKTKGEELEISTMIDYHARNAFLKQLQLRVGELANETRKLNNTEFYNVWYDLAQSARPHKEDHTLNELLTHILNCPDRDTNN